MSPVTYLEEFVMAEQVTVSKGDDVRVIPAELAKKYEAMGWKQQSDAQKSSK